LLFCVDVESGILTYKNINLFDTTTRVIFD